MDRTFDSIWDAQSRNADFHLDATNRPGPARPPETASHLRPFEGPARGFAGAVRISSAPEALWGWSYKSVIQIAGPKRRARAVVTERVRALARRQRALVLISGIRFELR